MGNTMLQSEFDSPRRKRRVIASYNTYQEAEQAVDLLSDQRFPVEHVSIIADGIKLVENVTGRATWAWSVGQGAWMGALIGLFTGFILGSFVVPPLVSALALGADGLIFGMIAGALIGVVSYALDAKKRDFTSVQSIQAALYSVSVDEEVADRAASLLHEEASARPAAND